MRVSSDYDPDASFNNLKTYDWMPGPAIKTGDPRIDGNSLLDARIRKALVRWFRENGYRKQTDGVPDFWVGYHATLDKKAQISQLNNHYGYSPGWGWRYAHHQSYGGGSYIYHYDQGTLIVDIVDPNTRLLLWRGSATDEVNLSSSPEQKQQKISTAVNSILSEFPPR